ncbi:MAG: 4-(cytidine 5'-diphospho)-2-C-methyl-D-erythritol kinase [Bacteroidota bacterium]
MSPPVSAGTLRRVAPAKINLGLHVLRRRLDGYHDVETVLLPVGWRDRLTVRHGKPFSFSCTDPTLPVDDRNLCVRAAHALAAHAGIEPHGALHLEKHVPHGAGLGGGSSDAAHTLRLLADWWSLEVPGSALHALAARLGSDVPFFLHDEAMLATGRGEVLEPLAAEPYRLPFALTIVMPPVHVSTGDAYALVQPNAEPGPDLRATVLSNDLERWHRDLVNDFQAPIFERYPEACRVRDTLVESGAGYAALSGSGAAVFGVFEQAKAARHAAHAAEATGLRAWWSDAA